MGQPEKKGNRHPKAKNGDGEHPDNGFGITHEIMEIALSQAKDGRLHILKEMSKALTTHRDDVGEHAPRIETLTVPQDKIRDIIGTGGKIIRDI